MSTEPSESDKRAVARSSQPQPQPAAPPTLTDAERDIVCEALAAMVTMPRLAELPQGFRQRPEAEAALKIHERIRRQPGARP